ncbi:hypothetical protein I4U23_005183 [Adineta vaga]|nr:hypothetical protein I4U23_005183 [Adineta vaga]
MDASYVQSKYPETSPPQYEYVPPSGHVQYIQQPPNNQLVYVVPMIQSYQNPEILQIRDWLPWSIVNIFIGWIFAGILPLIFSLICRSYKQSNNISGARTMSTLALVFNILVTLSSIAGYIGLIVAIVLASQATRHVTNCSYTLGYLNC